jgi:AGZA family xanthine/uracil permease-like MFS transporter
MLKRLEAYFEFRRPGTNFRTEILAGVTTFPTMAYTVLVNPAILSATGMPLAAVTAAVDPPRAYTLEQGKAGLWT